MKTDGGSSAEQRPADEDGDHHERRGHDQRVGATRDAAAKRVEAHAATVPVVDSVLVERDGEGIVTVTLNRPERKNAISAEMWDDLASVLDAIAASRDDRVVILTGTGDAFCSGADLGDAENRQPSVARGLWLMRRTARVAQRLHDLPQPAIAAVNGIAAGFGCNLALGCDLVIAASDARFSEIFLRRGLALDGGGSWLLPRLIGLHKAKELAFLADVLSAEEAAAFGIVNRVVPSEQLGEVVGALARRLAAQPPAQLSVVKRQLNHSFSMTMAELLEWECVAQAGLAMSADTREAMRAFLERRDPRFTGE